ncbi:uncharacterized protein LOC131853387 [Achroia grisella]|uniref:uncharacterized protein LOC131853387 n=1 Tax=Achroia grisella TaxID=688607 RepID=UPI0027D2EB46|nr:uncharacterized protein LOC131853387 [Achroia grisella]
MLLIYFYFNLLFLPLLYGKNSIEHDTNTNMPSSKKSHEDDSNIAKVTLVSEGGPILPITSPLTVLKENHTNLISIDKEFGKNKERPVVPRKGVKYPTSQEKKSLSNNTTELPKDSKQNKSTTSAIISMSSKDNKNKETTEKVNNVPEIKNITVLPLKPTVLSYEALAEVDEHTKNEQLSIKSSSESVIDQIPNPNVKKIEAMNSSRPDLIMPVVITILTVPLFAVLGYMALRRGQEAWKNRHYKRMDFLLDGMYND